jgi:Bacterial capsule synthesis protein PGA_cap
MKKIVLLGILLLTACTRVESTPIPVIEEVESIEPQTVSFVAVGDNLIHDAIYQAAYQDGIYDFKPFYHSIKPFINGHDLAFINQETMLGGTEMGLSSYPSFNSPIEVGEAIIDAGFNLISIANNHTLDRGEQAILNTIDYLDQQPVIYSGATRSDDDSDVKLFEKNGIRFGFVAYTMLTNGQTHPNGKLHLANLYSREKAKRDIEQIRDEVDFVLVSMHWGQEYVDYPNQVQINEAEYLASLEVDVILGHHPHVVQPIKIIDYEDHSTYVAYSLGNFLSAQVGIDRKIGMAFHLNFNKEVDLETKETNIYIDGLESHLIYHYKDSYDYRVLLYREINEIILPEYQKYFDEKVMLIKSYVEDLIIK